MAEIAVKFHHTAEDALLKFAVISAYYNGKPVLCRHRERTTYEIPGGHREPGEEIRETAMRELWEETGALEYSLRQVCPYSVIRDGEETFGMLYCAEITGFGPLPETEIAEVRVMETLPAADRLTYPLIQPELWKTTENFRNQ